MGASIAALKTQFEGFDEALAIVAEEEKLYQQTLVAGRADMAHIRKADEKQRVRIGMRKASGGIA